jgi:hypothetical protein
MLGALRSALRRVGLVVHTVDDSLVPLEDRIKEPAAQVGDYLTTVLLQKTMFYLISCMQHVRHGVCMVLGFKIVLQYRQLAVPVCVWWQWKVFSQPETVCNLLQRQTG